jgi:hypothetical protein
MKSVSPHSSALNHLGGAGVATNRVGHSRRQFVKRGALLVPMIFVPQLMRAQAVLSADGLSAFVPNPPAGGGGGGDITSNLVGWWKLDDGSGSTAVDSSSSGNNGTLTNSPTWVSGHVGSGALSFVSSSSQVVTANTTALSGLTKATLAAWINRTSTANKVAVGAGSISGANRFNFLWYLDGNVYFAFGNANSAAYASCALSGTGWHHVVLAFDGTLTGNARIAAYIDGVTKTLTYNTTPPSSLPTSSNFGNFLMGKEVENGFTDCTLDEVRIYSRALPSTDVSTLYAYAG